MIKISGSKLRKALDEVYCLIWICSSIRRPYTFFTGSHIHKADPTFTKEESVMCGKEGHSNCWNQNCYVCCWWCEPKPQPKPPCKCHQEKPCCKPKPCVKPEPYKPCHQPWYGDQAGWAVGQQAQFMPMDQQWYGGQEAAHTPYAQSWDAAWYGGQEVQNAPEANNDYGQAPDQSYVWPWQA